MASLLILTLQQNQSKTAIEQAEEKAGIVIEQVNVGLPANLLQIEPTQGMIPVTSEYKRNQR